MCVRVHVCVWLVLMAVLAAFEHRSVSPSVSQVWHFKISPREIRTNQEPERRRVTSLDRCVDVSRWRAALY